MTRDGERELHTPGPGEVLSHGGGYSRHICSPLTLEKQQRGGQRAARRAGRGAAGPGDSATSLGREKGRPRLFEERRGRSTVRLEEAAPRRLPPGQMQLEGWS